MTGDLQHMSMVELFRMEAESQLAALTGGLLSLEQGDTAPLEAMMRAAHSLKGAGRIVGIDAAVAVAHVMEDCFVAAQRHQVTLGSSQVDQLLQGVDILTRIAHSTDAELPAWERERMPEVAAFVAGLKAVLAGGPPAAPAPKEPAPAPLARPAPSAPPAPLPTAAKPPAASSAAAPIPAPGPAAPPKPAPTAETVVGPSAVMRSRSRELTLASSMRSGLSDPTPCLRIYLRNARSAMR